MSDVAPPIVVGLGEVLWDFLPDSRLPGGAPANVAYQANQLGCAGVMCSRVGRDGLGDAFLEFAESRDLQTDWIQRDADHATGRADVQVDSHGSPEFVIQSDVAWDYLEASQHAQSLMHRASAVCFGTLAQRSETSRRSIHTLLECSRSDCLLVYDVNLRQDWYQRAWIDESLQRARIAKLNLEEAETLSCLLELQADTPQAVAAVLRERFEIDLVCITCGADGCLLLGAEGVVEVSAEPLDAVDSVGCGDAFTAALIYSHWQDWSLRLRGQFANRVGGLVAARAGAMPDLTAELSQLRSGFGDRLP